ncbi:MAG: rhodanese-like domain-containing protein [bacterium]
MGFAARQTSVAYAVVLATLLLAACPVGGPDTNGNDSGLPQNDVAVDADDGGPDPCGNGVCDEALGEDCESCLQDCRGVSCSAVLPLTIQEYRDVYMHLVLGQTVVDLRDHAVCMMGRIPGDTFCTELEFWWDGAQITDNGGYLDAVTNSLGNPLIFYGWEADAALVLAVAEASVALGYSDVLTIWGGIDAWELEGWYKDITQEGLNAHYYPPTAGVLLIDTMEDTDFELCHVADATHLAVVDIVLYGEIVDGGQALLDLSDPADDDVLIFFCVNSACESSEQASEVAEWLGYANILHYKEGTHYWVCDQSLPAEGADCTGYCSTAP